jgi:uracil-DNA glycosylase family 4
VADAAQALMTRSTDRAASFSLDCRRCERLARQLEAVRAQFNHYHARPVAPFGDPAPRLLIVGLAPGMHGANRTGRPFTGDYAGLLLYETLHRYGYSNHAEAISPDDGLVLAGCRITNAVKCLPPENKPTTEEVRLCNGYLATEIAALPAGAAILALGRIAHEAVVRAIGEKPRGYVFAHAARHALPGGGALFDSYHCSRYNTQTGRLTPQMFRDVFDKIRNYLG